MKLTLNNHYIMMQPAKIARYFLGFLFILTLTGAPQSAQAQPKKAMKYLEDGRLDDAVRILKRDFFGKKPQDESGYVLAQTYYRLNDYEDALDIMQLISEDVENSPEKTRFYADVLIANDDFSGAYLAILRLLSKDQNDLYTYLWLQKTADLLRWDSVNTGSERFNIQGINTVYNEYAPYFKKGGDLWYVTDINSLQSLFPASYSDQNVHLLYKAPYDSAQQKIGKPSMLVKNRKYYHHDGPFSSWPERELYAVTMRDVDAPAYQANLGIFFLNVKTGEEPTPFLFNGDFNTGHPTFNASGSRMYFASDRPGGYGQMDIWYCDWQDGQWSEPKNMGPSINTPSNEVFPRFREGRLYFSSDRRDMGYGGLDIYYSSEMLGFKNIYNLRHPINTPYDDFSPEMSGYRDGFIASNIPDGQGGDDVYGIYFYPEQKIHTERMARVKGADYEEGMEVEVVDGEGVLVRGMRLEEGNLFSMAGLKSRETYSIRLKGYSSAGLKIEVLDDAGMPAGEYGISDTEEGIRVELLDPEDYFLNKVYSEDDAVAQYHMKGKIEGEKGTDFSKAKVAIGLPGGVPIATTQPDPKGNFSFKGLKYGTDYQISTEGVEGDHEIDIYGESGAIAQSIKPLPGNNFSYKRSVPSAGWMLVSEVENKDAYAVILSEDITTPAPVIVRDMNQGESLTAEMDEDGFIGPATLRTKRVYEIEITEGTLDPSDRLVLLRSDGDTSQTVRPHNDKIFRFEYMLQDEAPKDSPDEIMAVKPRQSLAETLENFRAIIHDYDLGANLPMVLTDSSTTRSDTLFVRENGALVMRELKYGEPYTLSTVDTLLKPVNALKIMDAGGKIIFVTDPDKGMRKYSFVLLEAEDVKADKLDSEDGEIAVIDFEGNAYPKEKSDRIPLSVHDADRELLTEGYTGRDGSFSFKDVPEGDLYYVHFPEKVPDTLMVRLPEQNKMVMADRVEDRWFSVDMRAEPMADVTEEKERREFTVPHVYYNFNSYYLLEKSRRSLDMLTRYLRQNPDTRIEIRSYTDSRGPKDYNQLLSDRRANAVKEYLLKKGIEDRRLATRGFGESGIVNQCVDEVECTEEEHAVNRRTTFVILD